MRPTSACAPILLAVILCAGAYTLAQSVKFPSYRGHINDFANVVDDAEEQRLETILLNFERRTGAQIAVATISSLNERPIEEYANGLYRAWGIGQKSGDNKNKGLLLLVATGDKRSRLEVGYGLEGDLPDGLAGELLRRMRPYFKDQNYTQGLSTGVQTILATLAQKWNVSLEGIDQRYAYAPDQDIAEIHVNPVFILVFFIFVVLFLMLIARAARRSRRSRTTWMGGPMIWGSGGGGFGGGDWGSSSGWGSGGGDGGSSWGGFGGGDSGGGGASDSW